MLRWFPQPSSGTRGWQGLDRCMFRTFHDWHDRFLNISDLAGWGSTTTFWTVQGGAFCFQSSCTKGGRQPTLHSRECRAPLEGSWSDTLRLLFQSSNFESRRRGGSQTRKSTHLSSQTGQTDVETGHASNAIHQSYSISFQSTNNSTDSTEDSNFSGLSMFQTQSRSLRASSSFQFCHIFSANFMLA